MSSHAHILAPVAGGAPHKLMSNQEEPNREPRSEAAGRELREKESDVKAKARIAALFNRSGAGRDTEGVACASRVSADVHGSGAPAAGRGRLAFACAASASASLIVMVVLLLTFVAPAAASEGCPNEARREEQGAAGRALPDCRAYELASPAYMPSPAYEHYFNGVPPLANTGFETEEPVRLPNVQNTVSIAINGNAALFSAQEPNSQADGYNNNLSRRGPNGWVGENIEPPQSRHGFLCLVASYAGFSQNLEQIVFRDGYTEDQTGGQHRYIEDCGHDEPRLVPGESEGSANLFLRDTATGSFQLLNVTPPGVKSYDPWFAAISADGSHVVFQSRALLTPDAPSTEFDGYGSNEYCANEFGDVYVSSAGTLHLLTVLPNGTPVRGTLAGARPFPAGCHVLPVQSSRFTHSVSADGERMLFYGGGGFKFKGPSEPNIPIDYPYIHGGLYLRQHPAADQSALNGAGECTEAAKACTIQIDLPGGGSGSRGGGQFQWASADTSKVFFTDEEKLTSDSTGQAGKPDLYEYDLEKPQGQRLTDLTANAGEPAEVLGVSGASEDGSYVYFVAKGVLNGTQENSQHANAQAGKANLYLRYAGATTFIVTLDAAGGDRCDWTAFCLSSRVSANGAFIAFDSIDSLTGYDNHPVHPEACEPTTLVPSSPCMETFRYAVASGAHGELTCASCNPTGAPPASEFAWSVIEQVGYNVGQGYSAQLSYNISNSGAVFFDTMEALVPADENKTWDVYQYDGGEGPSSQLHLISSGKSELPSYFDNATPDGRNVFFVTAQALVRSDTRTDFDLYDARVGGGFAEPLIPQCEAEGCRRAYPSAAGSSSPGSASFEGKGNVHPAGTGNPHPAKCKKGFVKKKGKCAKQRKKKSKKAEKKKSKKSIRKVAK
jgi:hypothetical protein